MQFRIHDAPQKLAVRQASKNLGADFSLSTSKFKLRARKCQVQKCNSTRIPSSYRILLSITLTVISLCIKTPSPSPSSQNPASQTHQKRIVNCLDPRSYILVMKSCTPPFLSILSLSTITPFIFANPPPLFNGISPQHPLASVAAPSASHATSSTAAQQHSSTGRHAQAQ